MTELEKEYVLIRQKRDEVPEGTLSCPDRNLAVFHHYRHYEGLRLLPSVCDSKLIQQTLIISTTFNVIEIIKDTVRSSNNFGEDWYLWVEQFCFIAYQRLRKLV